MKGMLSTRIIMIVLLISAGGSLFSQTFTDTTKVWHTRYSGYFGNGTETIRLTSDTTFNQMTYKRVERAIDPNSQFFTFYGYLREDSSSLVYYTVNATEPEKMLYNFDIEPSDTVTTNNLIDFNTHTFHQCTYVADSIDSIPLGSIYHKRINLHSVNHHFLEQWVETMGSLEGILHNQDALFGGPLFRLLCFFENDTLLYVNPNFNNCYVSTGTSDADGEGKAAVVPDPIRDISVLSVSFLGTNPTCLNIYNSSGMLRLTSSFHGRFLIRKEDLGPGIYFFLIMHGKTSQSGKFVIL